MLRGIDISKWQPTTPSLTGLSFVIVKASQGTTIDPMFTTHYANCRKAGVVTMAYHWGTDAAVLPLADQVAAFLSIGDEADFLWLDQEESGFTDDEAQEFVDGMRATGRACGLYHSSCKYGGVKADAKWVADTRAEATAANAPMKCDLSAPMANWDMWQYSSANNLDKDYLNPASPLADLLRLGYVQRSALDAANLQVVKLTDANAKLTETLASAPGVERERIAVALGNAEADRVRTVGRV